MTLQRRAILSSLAVAIAGCNSPQRQADHPLVVPPATAEDTPDSGITSATQSCSVNGAAPEPLAVHSVVHVADLAGQRWFTGLEGHGKDERAVLLHLDPAGHVVTTPLPAWTERVAALPPRTLRFLVTAPEPKWWAVDVSDPEAPALGEVVRLPDLAPGRFPKAYAADATRAVVALYEENPSDAGPRYIGRTALFEVPSGKRLSADYPTTAWVAECEAGRCFALASPNNGGPMELIEITAREQRVISNLNSIGSAVRDGANWFLIDCSESATGAFTLGLGDGSLRRGVLDVPAESCHSLRSVSLGARRGVGWRVGASLEVVSLDRTLRGERVKLGRFQNGQQDIAPVSDGLVVADYESRSGMMHSPEDREIRRYFRVWEFAGRAGFIPRSGGRFGAFSDVVALPHDGEEGKFTSGYDAHVLTRGAYATVVVVGEQSSALRLREPCPRGPQ